VKRSERFSDQHEVDKVSLFLSMSQRSFRFFNISESRSTGGSVYANSDSSRFGSRSYSALEPCPLNRIGMLKYGTTAVILIGKH
jgi:hypothetical protein